MANSKSSIYPIQLQNAELNLNKYDAEIKQYSGFNKNNAPFVGGCLSNIFTKKETIINGSDKTVYIDEEGNIYRVVFSSYSDVWFLYKNDDVVMSGSGSQFFENKKLSFPMNAIKIINEELYIRMSDEVDFKAFSIVGLDGIKFKRFGATAASSIINIANYTGADYEEFGQNLISYIYVSPDGEKNYCIIANFFLGSMNIIALDLDPVIENGEKVYNFFSKSAYYYANVSTKEPLAICWDEDYTKQFSFFFAQNGDAYKFVEFYTLDFTNYEITKVDEGYNMHTTISETILESGEKLIPTNLMSWHILSYPENKAILSRQIPSDNIFNITDNTAFKIIGRLETPYFDGQDGTKIKFRTKTVMNYTEVKTVATSYRIKIGEYWETNDSTRTPYICALDVQNAVSENYNEDNLDNFKSWIVHQINDNYALNGFHFTDYDDAQNYIVIKRGSYALGDFIKIGKGLFYFAVNNNLLTGICGKYVLLTEWNSIEAKNVYLYNDYRASKKINGTFDERIIYKVNNNWYEIKLAEKPSLNIFENQIVVNANSNTNSYDFKRNKVLHFATPYNSFIDSWHKKNNASLYDLRGQENDYYVAGAVRPYNQEDNSSIILNPVDIAVQPNGNYKTKRNFLALHFDEYVDIFSNARTEDTNINYMYSAKWNGTNDSFKIDVEMLDLPFPIDSNGNVEYNVNLFSKIMSTFGNASLIKSQLNSYPLVIGNNNNILMNYYLASGVEGLEELFVIQGAFYGILNNYICSLYYSNGVVSGIQFIVNVEGLQYCGNSPYEALFYSATNKCLYSFTGTNLLNTKQFIDKIEVVKSYKYNPATQSIFLLTDIGVLVSSLFGAYMIDMPEAESMFLLRDGAVFSDNKGNYRYIKYYKKDIDEDYLKENVILETCYYGMNNQTVTINDCLYMRLFSEDHEEGSIEVSAVTLSLEGRKTEKTTFKIKKTDWDKQTHTIYLRYQPKEQRGLGISFKLNSPFKVASMSVGSVADAILVDKVSKGAINAPFNNTSSTIEW